MVRSFQNRRTDCFVLFKTGEQIVSFFKSFPLTNFTRKVDPWHLIEIHKIQLNWLSAELPKPFDGTTIVVTHHAPSRRSLDRRDADSFIAAAYASNLDGFIEGKNIDVWIHGHIHENQDCMIGNTRIVANPYGYKEDFSNPDFKPDFVLEV